MRITVNYTNGKIDVFDTNNLTDIGALFSRDPLITTEMTLRFDLLETEGLLLEVLAYTLTEDDLTATIDDEELGVPLPCAGREAGCFVRLVSPHELSSVLSIIVDGTSVVWRHGEHLINGVRFHHQEALCLSSSSLLSANAKAIALFDYLKKSNPALPDEEITALFGYPYRAYREILLAEASQGESVEGKESEPSKTTNQANISSSPDDMRGLALFLKEEVEKDIGDFE